MPGLGCSESPPPQWVTILSLLKGAHGRGLGNVTCPQNMYHPLC
jgi:hypothetical protein